MVLYFCQYLLRSSFGDASATSLQRTPYLASTVSGGRRATSCEDRNEAKQWMGLWSQKLVARWSGEG